MTEEHLNQIWEKLKDPNTTKQGLVTYHLKAHFKCYKKKFLLLQYLNPTRSYFLLFTSRCNKNPQKITTSLPCCSEAIQPEHIKVVVVSYLHMYYTCTKCDRNLRRVSIFCVDLTWNYPYSNNVYNANGNKIIRLSENHSLVWCCYIATKYRVNVSNMILLAVKLAHELAT